MPRLRRLRDPQRHPGVHARAWPRARAHRLRLRNRRVRRASRTTCRRTACTDPRPCTRDRDGSGRDAAGSLGVGRDRRRGLARSAGTTSFTRSAGTSTSRSSFSTTRSTVSRKGSTRRRHAWEGDEIDADGLARPPLQPLSVAIGAEASFVARAIDTDKKGPTEVLGAAARHRGSAFVEILQNCNIYNDGAFDFVREDKGNWVYLDDGARIRFGTEAEKGAAVPGRLASGRRGGGGG